MEIGMTLKKRKEIERFKKKIDQYYLVERYKKKRRKNLK